MMDVESFTDEQKSFLAMILSDFSGPTATPKLLYMMENIMYTLKSDWDIQSFSQDPELKADIEVCIAALNYLKIDSFANLT